MRPSLRKIGYRMLELGYPPRGGTGWDEPKFPLRIRPPSLEDVEDSQIKTGRFRHKAKRTNTTDSIMTTTPSSSSSSTPASMRKWHAKIIGKICSGDYRLGANSANIIVQSKMTGQFEEKIQVRMEGGRARKLPKSLSIEQGLKYDNPAFAADIPVFIEFHNLNVDEILDPLDSFKTLNQLFYRELKASGRPIEQPENHNRLVSTADRPLMAFETVAEASSEFEAMLLPSVIPFVFSELEHKGNAATKLLVSEEHETASTVDAHLITNETINANLTHATTTAQVPKIAPTDATSSHIFTQKARVNESTTTTLDELYACPMACPAKTAACVVDASEFPPSINNNVFLKAAEDQDLKQWEYCVSSDHPLGYQRTVNGSLHRRYFGD
ncbi:hypothetical protein ONZ45_g8838 [Pleurotus djamor]|nr:hypothetical protein ONZ45_g8838 [Pleurotus djamor]